MKLAEQWLIIVILLWVKTVNDFKTAINGIIWTFSKTAKIYNNNPKGSGLIYTGKTIVPFKNEFPKDLDLYTLMSTDPKDFEKQQKILLQK